ncbi:hypothetical protein ON010_g4016 [Phytophthora cinnamomi]|nr:hypothetical protein ON010_g4016 [Phytophthora cinnamomi]
MRTRDRLAAALKELRRRLHEQLVLHERRRLLRVRHYATLNCIPDPSESDWMKLWQHGSDANFIHFTSLDRFVIFALVADFTLNELTPLVSSVIVSRTSFRALLRQFSGFYNLPGFSPKGGRPPRFKFKHQALAVILVFYVDSLHAKMACMFFGAPPATLSRVLNAAEVALGSALNSFRPARISWPSPTRQRALAKLTALREPLLQFTWGFIDGKNLKVLRAYFLSTTPSLLRFYSFCGLGQVLQPADPDVQNAFYNGWLHDVFVTGTLCFGADGLIVWARHNCPGSWNDAENCVEFRENLMNPDLCPDMRYGVVADSAFPCSGHMTGRILTPLKEGDLGRLIPSVRESAQILSAAITSIRQAAEWGMGSVEKVYKRLLLPLPPDKSKRALRLDNLFRLSNFRVRSLEISQIRTTFFTELTITSN